jgi:phage shock protein C
MNCSTNCSRPLYRSRQGWVLGVCQGIADFSGIAVLWIRLGCIGVMIFSGFWPLFIGYVVAAIFMKPAPLVQPRDDQDWEFYAAYSSDRRLALARLRRQFDSLDRRTRRMEERITNREYDWERRLRSQA